MSKRNMVRALVAATLVLLAGGGYWFARRERAPDPVPIPLAESVRRGDLAAVQAYLDSGGSPDAEIEINGRRMTLLKEAIYDRETAVALLLLDGGADFAASGATLSDVGANGMTELVERLLPEAALLPGATAEDLLLTGVSTAASHGYLDTVQSYIRFAEGRRADEWLGTFGYAAGSALLGGHADVARALFDAGGWFPGMLHGVSTYSSPGMVRYLLAKGFDPTEVFESDDPGLRERTPLDFALKSYRNRTLVAQDHPTGDTEYLRSRDAEYILFELLRAGAPTDNAEILAIARDGLAEIRAAPPDARLALAARIGYTDIVADLLQREGGGPVRRCAKPSSRQY